LAGALVRGEVEVNDRSKWLTFEQLLAADTQVSLINEPVDFVVDFAAEEPKRESATERALRIWFKREERPVS
jgi:hypothetical protein